MSGIKTMVVECLACSAVSKIEGGLCTGDIMEDLYYAMKGHVKDTHHDMTMVLTAEEKTDAQEN